MNSACAIDCHVLVSPPCLLFCRIYIRPVQLICMRVSLSFCGVFLAMYLSISHPNWKKTTTTAGVVVNSAIRRSFCALSVHGFQVTEVVDCLRRSAKCSFTWRRATLVQTIEKLIRHWKQGVSTGKIQSNPITSSGKTRHRTMGGYRE
jgi:hypothetical protein